MSSLLLAVRQGIPENNANGDTSSIVDQFQSSPNDTTSQAPGSSSPKAETSSSASTATSSKVEVGSQATASGSAQALPSTNSQGDNDTALHAGLGVLGAALLIALVVIGFLLFRRRRRSPSGHAAPTAYSDTTDPESTAVLGSYGEKRGASVGGTGAGASALSIALPAAINDKLVNGRFARLDTAIQDWVAGTFRNGTPVAPESLDTEMTTALNNVSAEWKSLLVGDQRARFMLLRGLVAAILSQAWANGELLGDTDTARVSSRISNGTSNPQTALWRAQTFALLATSSVSRTAQTAAIEQLTSRIDSICGALVLSPGSTSAALRTRSQRLRTVVANASELALDLGQQRVAYAWHSPVGGNAMGEGGASPATPAPHAAASVGSFDRIFDSKEMEDALQEQTPNRLDGRRVKAIIFPAISRWGSADGGVGSWERAAVVRRAGVLV